MVMTQNDKQEFIKHFITLLDEVIEVEKESFTKSTEPAPPELLTIRECAQTITGLTEHAIRRLVAEGKIQHIRIGEKGKRGKILIPKSALLEYFKISA